MGGSEREREAERWGPAGVVVVMRIGAGAERETERWGREKEGGAPLTGGGGVRNGLVEKAESEGWGPREASRKGLVEEGGGGGGEEEEEREVAEMN